MSPKEFLRCCVDIMVPQTRPSTADKGTAKISSSCETRQLVPGHRDDTAWGGPNTHSELHFTCHGISVTFRLVNECRNRTVNRPSALLEQPTGSLSLPQNSPLKILGATCLQTFWRVCDGGKHDAEASKMAITTCALNTGKAMHEGMWEQVS